MSRKPEKLRHWCIVFKDSDRQLDEKERWKVGQEGDGELELPRKAVLAQGFELTAITQGCTGPAEVTLTALF